MGYKGIIQFRSILALKSRKFYYTIFSHNQTIQSLIFSKKKLFLVLSCFCYDFFLNLQIVHPCFSLPKYDGRKNLECVTQI